MRKPAGITNDRKQDLDISLNHVTLYKNYALTSVEPSGETIQLYLIVFPKFYSVIIGEHFDVVLHCTNISSSLMIPCL